MDNKIVEIIKKPISDVVAHEGTDVALDENDPSLPDCCKYTELANYDQWEIGLQNHNGPSHYVERMKEVLATQREWERDVRLPMITEMREQWFKMQKEQQDYDKLEVGSDGEDDEAEKNKCQLDQSHKIPSVCRRSKKRKNSPCSDEHGADDVRLSPTTNIIEEDNGIESNNTVDEVLVDELTPNISTKPQNELNQAKRLNEAKRSFDRLKRRYEVAEQKQTSWLMEQLSEIKQNQCN